MLPLILDGISEALSCKFPTEFRSGWRARAPSHPAFTAQHRRGECLSVASTSVPKNMEGTLEVIFKSPKFACKLMRASTMV